jgi:hypothetical protein
MRRIALVCAGFSFFALSWAQVGTTQVPTNPQQRQMDAVVRAWSERLNAGDNSGIAKLFSVPATIIQAPFKYRFRSRAVIAQWHASLPCSGRIIRISFYRDTATAVFRLGNRGVTQCDGPGKLAAARFTIVKGLITVWQQVAVPTHRSST